MREPILTYYDIASNVTAFSSTRHGGFSEGNFSAFNINKYCGDDEAHRRMNEELLCHKLRIKPYELIMPHQVHGKKVAVIDKSYFALTETARQSFLEGVDALLTRQQRICIGISTADCVPILLYDEENHAAAAIHAGWRGTQKKILTATIETMIDLFATKPSHVKAVLGPAISKANYEVGEEVIEQFQEAGFPIEMVTQKVEGRWHLDLVRANTWQMEQCGLQTERIILSGLCTFAQAKDYFSARRLGTASGRIFTGIILR